MDNGWLKENYDGNLHTTKANNHNSHALDTNIHWAYLTVIAWKCSRFEDIKRQYL